MSNQYKLRLLLQGAEVLSYGPGATGASCLRPILSALESAYLPTHRPALYKAAWHLVALVAESRSDNDTLLRTVTGGKRFLDIISHGALATPPTSLVRLTINCGHNFLFPRTYDFISSTQKMHR